MATFSFGTTPGAPGTYINERVGNVGVAGIASFNTVYMLVEAEESVSVTNFPFNSPVMITSLADYKALVGGVVPQNRIPLLSFNCVNSFFQNAQVGDLRVVRVGTPNEIVEIEIFPSGSVINSSGIPTSIQSGDVVYFKLILNGQKLVSGDGSTGYTPTGEWLGVPVTMPVDFIDGDAVNNRKISKAIAEAIAEAIESNPSVRSSIYVRDYGLVNELTASSDSQNSFISIAAATYGGSVTAVTSQEQIGSTSVFASNGYEVENIVGLQGNLERVPQDYIQCINTAFDGQQDQGYLITPTAYAQFDAAGRAAIGAAAAAHCQSNDFKWLALADAGPFDVTDINKYNTFTPHLPASDLVTGLKYLVDNAIYEWTGTSVTYDKLRFQAVRANENPEVAIKLSKEAVASGEKVGAIDPTTYTIEVTTNGICKITSSSVWPADLYIAEVAVSNATDEIAAAMGNNSSGTLYIVAPPYNTDLYGSYPSDGTDQYVYLANSASNASSVYNQVLAEKGTSFMAAAPTNALPLTTGDGTADITYQTPAWDMMGQFEINGQQSNLLQNITDSTQYVNAAHMPGTLQETTEDYNLNFVSRVILNPSSSLTSETIGGVAYCKITCTSHKLRNGQKLFFTNDINYNSLRVFNSSNETGLRPYYVKVLSDNTFVLAASYSNYLSNNFVLWPGGAITTATPTTFYTAVSGKKGSDINFSDIATLAMIRGRKYGFGTGTINEQAKSTANVNTGSTVSIFLNNSSTVLGKQYIFPYGETAEAEWLPEFLLEGGTDESMNNFVCTPVSEQFFPSEVSLVPVLDPIPGGQYDAADSTPLSSLNDYADAILNTSDTKSAINGKIALLEGVYFEVTSNGTAPDETTTVSSGDKLIVVKSNGGYSWAVADADLSQYSRICYGSQVELSLTPEQTPPSNLWRFDAITSSEIIDSALRGVGFNGDPQAEFVEAGVDNVNRLYEDSQRYFNPFGFIAFYGSHVINASGQVIPPSPYVTGVASRRYRAEGFQFPPAGVKYQLSDAVSTQISINSSQQNILNPDGCNAVRTLPGYPDTAVFIWGGRTRINKDVADQRKFQFVNTRVIQNVVYGSLRNAFDNQIFSVVDGFGVLYNQITTIGTSVLSQLWVRGALFGARPSDAFQVICDERINRPENLENGLVYVKVFDVPVPTMERLEVDLIRVSIGQMNKELEIQGLG